MKFVSTSNSGIEMGLAEAVSKSIAPDGGLLLPAFIPRLPGAFFNNIAELTLQEIAYVVATSFFGEDIAPQALKRITDRTFAADMPLVSPLGQDGPFVLELFHGPTLTVKDFGAEFMSGIILELLNTGTKSTDGRHDILLSSSGNSALAIGNTFRRHEGGDLYIVCPRGSLRRRRHSILSSFGPHVHIIEISGDIDMCNAMVRTFISDENDAGNRGVFLANSVNIARLIPDSTFYFHSYARLRERLGADIAARAVYVVPCGNLTALCAAVIARRMGLPMGQIIGAETSTRALGNFLSDNITASGNATHSRYARSMNSDHPTNLPRLVSLCGGREGIIRELDCQTVSDDAIAHTIRHIRETSSYSLGPHSAVSFAIASEAACTGVPVVSLATAHPAVDIDTFTEITGAPVELPHQLTRLMNTKLSPVERIAPTVPALRKFIRDEKNRTGHNSSPLSKTYH